MRVRRYEVGARMYGIVSGERPVYRGGRILAIAQLDLAPGSEILDVGCGTGLNFAPLLRAGGRVLGIDASPAMLARARSRIVKHGWPEVTVRRGDAADLERLRAGRRFDAILFTYSLSIIAQWESALDQALNALRPGGRIAVVDMAMPTGRWRILGPLARLACFAGGADPDRHPWRRLEQRTAVTFHAVIRGGHVHVVVGRRDDGG